MEAMWNRGSPEWIWLEAIEKNILMFYVIEELSFNQGEWEKIIHAADPKSLVLGFVIVVIVLTTLLLNKLMS